MTGPLLHAIADPLMDAIVDPLVPAWFALTLAAVLGALIGSFLNVVV